MIVATAVMDEQLLNGTAPVKTYINAKQRRVTGHRSSFQYMTGYQSRTSIMIIAKEKTSASSLSAPSFKTSGAVHRVVWSCLHEVFCLKSVPMAIVAREKSVIRAWPVVSTRIFG